MNSKRIAVGLFIIAVATAIVLTQTQESLAAFSNINRLIAPPLQNGDTISHGPISGEVTDTSVVLWARGSQTGTLTFEVSDDSGFVTIVESATVAVDQTSDLTGKVTVEGLNPEQLYYYRTALNEGTPVEGKFNTAPDAETAADFNFLFGACLGGQGYCRDPETGWVIFDTMLAENPDFFMLVGDGVYIDSACEAPNNVPGSEGPFTDLDGIRSRYRYHLEDPHYAQFLAQTPVYVTWDDHEVKDDFGGPALNKVNPQLFADGLQAYFEYWPLTGTDADPNQIYRQESYGAHADFFMLDTRSYRDPNVNWDPNPRTLTPKTMLGADQFAWLQQALAESEATWKFIVTSVPLSYPTGFPQPEVDGRDSWANYTEPSGYETELMSLIFFIESNNIENVVFITGDTHWPFALSYDPDRNGEANFYEFGSSPISAITLPPVETLDPTFNPTVLYAEGEFAGTLFNFGHISVAKNGDLTFRVIDKEGTERNSLTIQPK